MTAEAPETLPTGKFSASVPARRQAWPADRVERRPVAALVASAHNARTHSPEQVAQIAASIREWGWTVPVLLDEQAVIIAGHGRVLAAQALGLLEIPVMVAAGWSEAQKGAYRVADNKLALNAGWDAEMLPIELMNLRTLGFELGLTGFGELELAKLLPVDLGDGDVDEAPEPPADPVSQSGDLWVCGEHRVLCGDATVLLDVEKVLDGALSDMIFCDPPFNVNYSNSATDKKRGRQRPILNDALGEGFGPFLKASCANMLTVTKGALYICMSSSELDTLRQAFREAGGRWSTFIVWAKSHFTLGRSDYQRQYEPILYGWKDGAEHYWCGARDQGDVWFFDKPVKNDLHPTMKPVALVERAIRNSSKSWDIVLDPFGGSGTTMIAAERTGRRARLLELDPRYVDVIVERWQASVGKEATLAGGDKTFAQVKANRQPIPKRTLPAKTRSSS